MPTLYDKKYLIKCLVGLVLMVGLMRVTQGAGFALILPLILLSSLRGKMESLLFLLCLSVAMMMGNGNLMPKGPVFGYAQRAAMMLVSLLMLVQIFGRRNSPLLTPLLSIFPYLVWMTLVSVAGWCPFISYLKLILFTFVFLAYYGVANRVVGGRRSNPAKMRSVFLSVSAFFILGSVALIPFPGISQMGSDEVIAAFLAGESLTSLFMGMSVHSQSLGPLCAMLGVALFADLVFNIRRLDKFYILLLLCVPLLIYKTSSRTAMGSFFVGVAFCGYFAVGARGLAAAWRNKIVQGLGGFAVVAILAMAAVPSVRDRVAGFVMKYNNGNETTLSQLNSDDVFSTRRGKWEEGISHFHESPVIGNGFQVSEDMRGLKPSLKTISAPIEKSIWISAVLEEGGAIGFVLFVLFLLVSVTQLKRRRAYVGLALLLVFTIINLGEFTFFSMSGLGGFSWALIFIGLMLDAQRQQSRLNQFV